MSEENKQETYKLWVYHATEAAKIIDSSEMAAYKKKGWVESPADVKPKDESK